MAYQPIEELLPKADWSIYKLVRMASNRALELSEGKAPLVEGDADEKLTTLALREIAEGMIVSKESAPQVQEELKIAKEEAEAQEEE